MLMWFSVFSLPCLWLYRMLGARIAELEHRLKVLEISGLWSSTSLVPDLTWNEDSRTDTGSIKGVWTDS